MGSNLRRVPGKNRSTILVFGWIVLLAAAAGSTGSAQTYISAEPIPSQQIVGTANLAAIEGIGYANMELWSKHLLNDCHIVQKTIDVLADNGAISTVLVPLNTSYRVAAGGFQGVTDPSYVFTIVDSGPFSVSQSDVWVVDNILGYVLNQGGTAQFGLRYDPSNPNEFANVYAVVTFAEALTGEHAEAFFNYLGTIDPALWTGTNAGFTQVNLHYFGPNDSMLFLIGNVTTGEFQKGLFEAATTTPGATYSPLLKDGKPTVAAAGAAFPGNDWIAYPGGDQYLTALVSPSARLLSDLAGLRQWHLHAVADLLKAIKQGKVSLYLNDKFTCPAR
jgi:hypothetical protein